MKNIIRNWKTSLIGSGAIAGAVSLFMANPSDWKTPLSMVILGALGIVAKDGNVTGV